MSLDEGHVPCTQVKQWFKLKPNKCMYLTSSIWIATVTSTDGLNTCRRRATTQKSLLS